MGAEVVYSDFEDQQSLVAALQGAYGVFGVTNCMYWDSMCNPIMTVSLVWESMDGEKEIQAGYALIDAAQVNGVQHFIWS